jgi:formylglycine-generating enzyme required for sulfatase activity
LLGPANELLVQPLSAICCDHDRDALSQLSAAEALAELLELRQQPATLARVALESSQGAFRILLRELVRLGRSDTVLEILHRALAERIADSEAGPRKDAAASRQAAAAIALSALGEPEVLWPLLRHHDDPRVRSLLIERLAADSLNSAHLIDRLSLPLIDPIERQALLLACAESRKPALASAVKAAFVSRAQELFLFDPHPGVHSAAELLLRRWGDAELLAQCNKHLHERNDAAAHHDWTVGPNKHIFAIIQSPLAFWMGATPHEKGGEDCGDRSRHYRRIERSLWVSTKEVTVEQFQAFDSNHRNDPRFGGEPNCAAIHIPWFGAAGYCNWLSELADIDKKEWCYPEKVGPGMVLAADAVDRTGFRLPTEAEWEYLCRARTVTSRPFGESNDLLPRYAWTWLNSGNRAMQPGLLLPNEFGLFDMLGNACEWCHDGPIGHFRPVDSRLPSYPHGTKQRPANDRLATETIDANDRAHETWRMVRGGAFTYPPDRTRSAFRDRQPSGDIREYLGFRVVRTLPSKQPIPTASASY